MKVLILEDISGMAKYTASFLKEKGVKLSYWNLDQSFSQNDFTCLIHFSHEEGNHSGLCLELAQGHLEGHAILHIECAESPIGCSIDVPNKLPYLCAPQKVYDFICRAHQQKLRDLKLDPNEILLWEEKFLGLNKRDSSVEFCQFISTKFKLQQIALLDHYNWQSYFSDSVHFNEDRRKKSPFIRDLVHIPASDKKFQNQVLQFMRKQDPKDFSKEILKKWNYNEIKLNSLESMAYLVFNGEIANKDHSHFRYYLKRFSQIYAEKLHYEDLEENAIRDDVTDLYNQKYLNIALDELIDYSTNEKQSFSVLFIDIDHFKRVNDSSGHRTGSGILKDLSEVLKQSVREGDFAFRYGGDEFLLLLRNTTSDEAFQIAERIRLQVESCHFICLGNKIDITLSIGIASFPEHATTKEQIIEIADQAMYYGKHKSRNIVCVAS